MASITIPDRVKLDWNFNLDHLRQDIGQLIANLNQQFYVYYQVVLLQGKTLDSCPYIKSQMELFETEIQSARVLRLEGGGVIKEHTDPTLDAGLREVVRLTVPIFSGEDVDFILNEKAVPMKPGELWYLRLSDPHSVWNNGTQERINLAIDVVYNDWLEQKLLKG